MHTNAEKNKPNDILGKPIQMGCRLKIDKVWEGQTISLT